jgi:hypothetical protein
LPKQALTAFWNQHFGDVFDCSIGITLEKSTDNAMFSKQALTAFLNHYFGDVFDLALGTTIQKSTDKCSVA